MLHFKALSIGIHLCSKILIIPSCDSVLGAQIISRSDTSVGLFWGVSASTVTKVSNFSFKLVTAHPAMLATFAAVLLAKNKNKIHLKKKNCGMFPAAVIHFELNLAEHI
jgi:hypothetical protein